MGEPTLFSSPEVAADSELISRAAAGDERAVADLYDRYGRALYSVAYRIVRDAADAEDVVVETFVQAWRNAGRFVEERGSAAAWFTMMARSRALDLARSRSRREKAMERAAVSDPDGGIATPSRRDDPGERVDAAERHRRVMAAMAVLSPPQRRAIELAFYEGLSHSEIAERLQEPLGTVKTRVRLGMLKLRELLRPIFFERAE